MSAPIESLTSSDGILEVDKTRSLHASHDKARLLAMYPLIKYKAFNSLAFNSDKHNSKIQELDSR